MRLPLILFGNTEKPIGCVELTNEDVAQDVLGVVRVAPERIEISPITSGGEPIAWSLGIVSTETRPDPDLSTVRAYSGVVRSIDDPRPITMLTFPFQEPDQPGLTIGCKLFGQEVAKIVAYEEQGELSMVLWYAIYGRKPEFEGSPIKEMSFAEGLTVQRDELLWRVQAKYVESIGYQEEAK